MALLKFNYGTSEKLNSATNAPVIKDGNVYITTDSQEMKVDINGKRLTISDFMTVTAAELETVAIYENLFYYVTDTKTIVKYVGTDAEGKRIWEGINNTDQIAGMNTRLITAEGEIDTLQDNFNNLDATGIDTSEDIVVTKAVGNYTVGQTIKSDTSVQDLLMNMLCSDSAPTITQPTLTMAGDLTYIEVGSSADVKVTSTYEDGKYQYGYATLADDSVDTTQTEGDGKEKAVKTVNNGTTGANVTSINLTYNDDTLVTETSSNKAEYTVTSGIQKVKASGTVKSKAIYTAGYIPVSILKNKYKSKAIAANNNKTASREVFRWYEPAFYGFKYENVEGKEVLTAPETISADQIKSLGTSITGENAYNLTVPAKAKADGSWRQYFIAIPTSYGKTLTKAVDTTNQPLPVNTKAENVNLTFGTAEVEYKVFYITFPSAFDTVEFNLTWA